MSDPSSVDESTAPRQGLMDIPNAEESQQLTGTSKPRKGSDPLGRIGLTVACALTHVLALALLILLSSTLKTHLSPDKPLLTWRTFPLHPFLMVLAFGLLSPVAAAAWKSYEHTLGISRPVVKLIHAVLMLAAMVVGIIGVADMWLVHEDGAAAQKAKGWAVHFQSAHSYVGLATLILFAVQAMGGITAFSPLPILGLSGRARVVEPHRLLGAAVAQQAAMIAIITGILSLSGRGDNKAPKDLEFKAAAILALALCLCLGMVLKP